MPDIYNLAERVVNLACTMEQWDFSWYYSLEECIEDNRNTLEKDPELVRWFVRCWLENLEEDDEFYQQTADLLRDLEAI